VIVTVTPSPAIDWTVNVDSFEFAAVNKVASKTREASGKGINVSVALNRNHVDTTAVSRQVKKRANSWSMNSRPWEFPSPLLIQASTSAPTSH
jgi:hypothetical protein